MKVLFVHNHYQVRSGEALVFEHDRRAAELAGHEVIAYTRDNRELDDYGPLQQLTLGARTSWAWDTQRELTRMIARERPSIAHFVNTLPLISPAAFWTCHNHAVPVVYNVQNYRLACPAATFLRNGAICTECPQHGLARSVIHACYRGSRAASAAVAWATKLHRSLGTYAHAVDRYLVPSQFMARTLARYANIEEHKLIVKANTVTPDPGPQVAPGEYLLFVGRLTVEKGILTLLDAYARLADAPVLRIVGEGPLHAQITERVATDARLQRVELIGALPHEQAVACIREARALIVPSQWYEGVPLSLLEAFACAVPVIAGRIGSLAEVVRSGDNGLLFEAGDAADLARVIGLLLRGSERARAFGTRGRECYLARHTLEQGAQALTAIYRDVVAARPVR